MRSSSPGSPGAPPVGEPAAPESFDFDAPAELFVAVTRRRHGAVTFKRFETAAEAIRHAMEEQPDIALMGTTLEVDEERYGGAEIRTLYESPGYPLPRRNSG